MSEVFTTLASALTRALRSAELGFDETWPFPHAVGESLAGTAVGLFERAAQGMPFRRRTEAFYTQDECVLRPGLNEGDEVVAALANAPAAISVLDSATKLAGSACDSSATFIHRMQPNDFTGIHNDANAHGELLRLCWMIGDAVCGGSILVHTPSQAVRRVEHRRDRWFLFRLSPESLHSVEPVDEASAARWSIVFAWGTPACSAS